MRHPRAVLWLVVMGLVVGLANRGPGLAPVLVALGGPGQTEALVYLPLLLRQADAHATPPASPTPSVSVTASPTALPSPSLTPSLTPVPVTLTPPPSETPTATATATATRTPSLTVLPSLTTTGTATASATRTWTPTGTATRTLAPTASVTATPSPTPSRTASPTGSLTTPARTPTRTPTPNGTAASTRTPTITNTPTPPRPGSNWAAVPALGVNGLLVVQNNGDDRAKAAALFFGDAPSECGAAAAPRLDCTGLLAPGGTWTFLAREAPATSAFVFSFDPFPTHNPSAYRCEQLAALLQTAAWPTQWPGYGLTFPLGWNPFYGQPIGVEVSRLMPPDPTTNATALDTYLAPADTLMTRYDPLAGAYVWHSPAVYAGVNGVNTEFDLQNLGGECGQLTLVFRPADTCESVVTCHVPLPPAGYSLRYPASACVPAGFSGSVTIHSPGPLGGVVDHRGSSLWAAHPLLPNTPCLVGPGGCVDNPGGALVLVGPYARVDEAWGTRVVAQNLSSTQPARIKLYGLGQYGDIQEIQVVDVCAGGSHTFSLTKPETRMVRLENQWFDPDNPTAEAGPIGAVAELWQTGGAGTAQPPQVMTYPLMPQGQGFVWTDNQAKPVWGVPVVGLSNLLKAGPDRSSRLAILNTLFRPGSTDVMLLFYQGTDLVEIGCETLPERSAKYIDLADLVTIPPGFRGSLVISATGWNHDTFDAAFQKVVGLAATRLDPGGYLDGDRASVVPGALAPKDFARQVTTQPLLCPTPTPTATATATASPTATRPATR